MPLSCAALFGRRAAALTIATTLGLASAASAQSVALTFSGGSGSPLLITFSTPITYTIGVTPDTTNNYPLFVFEIPGTLFGGANSTISLTGAPTYSRNGSGAFTLNTLGSGMTGAQGAGGTNFITSSDMWIGNGPSIGSNMIIGDVFTLSAGTFTTANFSGTAPASGSYTTFLADSHGANLGTGTPIPEPSTHAVFAGATMLGLALWRHRRRQAGKLPA